MGLYFADRAGPPPGGTLLLFLMSSPSSETTALEKPEHQETKPTKNFALRESTLQGKKVGLIKISPPSSENCSQDSTC